MGACRECKQIEREFDKLVRSIRNLDKILWSYCGKDIERSKYPKSDFGSLEEEIEDFSRIYWDFIKEYNREKTLVNDLNNKLYPPKVDFDKVKSDAMKDSILSALIPKS